MTGRLSCGEWSLSNFGKDLRAMTLSDFLSEYVDRPQLAKALGVSVRTIARYEDQPDGLPCTVLGGKKRYRLASIYKWIEGREKRRNTRRKAA
jgi:hypothetical protein